MPSSRLFGDEEVEAEAQPLAELEVHAFLGMRLLPVEHDVVHRPAFGRAAADHALDAVLGHEVERALGRALHRLPAFDRQAEGPRHDGQVLEVVAAIGHARRDRVVLALMREGGVVERLEDDVDLLLEQLAVRGLVEQRRAEGLDFTRVVAAADAEGDAPAGQDVRHRVVLGQPQRMPHRRDVEAAADIETPGEVGEVQRHHHDVGDALVAFALEMMLGHPEGVVAETVHELRHALRLVEDGGELLVRIAPLVGGRRVLAHVAKVDVAGEIAS